MKELSGPPMKPVRWLGELKDGRKAILIEKLWYSAREALCRHFGVTHDHVLDVRLATPDEAADTGAFGGGEGI